MTSPRATNPRGASGKGIRRHGLGWQASVYVAGEGREFHAFPLDTPIDDMQRWRAAARARLTLRRSSLGRHAAAGTFEADMQRYLKAVAAMPDVKGRVRDMGRWLSVFVGRRSLSIQPHEIRAQRDQWLLHGPIHRYDQRRKLVIKIDTPLAQSTVNHRLRALENFYTVMFPREANPVRSVPEAEEPEPQDRSVSYVHIELILSKMPDVGKSERGKVRSTVSKSKARLRLMAYSGLTQQQIMQLTKEDIDLTIPAVRLERRRKGKGAAGGWRPLPQDATSALEGFIAAKAWGRFSCSALRHCWQRACVALDLPRTIRPYDLRHSFASTVLEQTQDMKATQHLLGHSSAKTTQRYAAKAIPSWLSSAAAKVKSLRQGIVPE